MCSAVSKYTGLALFTFLLLITWLFTLFSSTFSNSVISGVSQSPSPCFCETPDAISHAKTADEPAGAHLQVFRTIPEFEDLTEVGDATWSKMSSTKQGGFLWVRHNETYRTGHGVSMFHALHCLSMLRGIIKGSQGAVSSHVHNPKRGTHGGKSEDEMHAGHCLSYIAQSLLCSADGTLERPKTYTDDAGNILRDDVDGEDIVHKCRGADNIRAIIEQTEMHPLKSLPSLEEGSTIWDLFDEIG